MYYSNKLWHYFETQFPPPGISKYAPGPRPRLALGIVRFSRLGIFTVYSAVYILYTSIILLSDNERIHLRRWYVRIRGYKSGKSLFFSDGIAGTVVTQNNWPLHPTGRRLFPGEGEVGDRVKKEPR